MRHLIGFLLMAVGALHVLYVFVTSFGPLVDIAREGLVNAVDPHLDRAEAFWSLMSGLLFITLGYVVHWMQARIGSLPAFPGWALLGIALVGVILMPFSGFWAFIPLAIVMLVVSRQGRLRSTALVPGAGSRHGLGLEA